MRLRGLSLLLWVAGLLAFVAADGRAQVRIPAVRGNTLSGEKVELPEGLKGKVGVLVVGFSQASRDEVTQWGKRLSVDFRESGTVVYYEMPVLESVPRLLRGWVLKKIAEAVPDRAKGRFLPLMDRESEWKKAAGFRKADDAYVLLVDGSGVIRWVTEGAVGDAGYGELRRRVGELVGR